MLWENGVDVGYRCAVPAEVPAWRSNFNVVLDSGTGNIS